MKKGLFAFVFIALITAYICSCSSNPNACFTIITPADSIHVGRTVSFSAGCSSDATQYYWDFGNGKNSSAGPTTTAVYDSAATYSVNLVVSGGGKTGSATKSLTVLP